MEPDEIFKLIVKADEALKYATADKTGARARQARGFLDRAVEEAGAIGNDGLVALAEQRIADLERLGDEG